MTTQTPDCKPRALIAMSGGVDSSVAAWLMQQAGYDCTGITMRLTRNETLGQSGFHTCCSEKDIEDAAEVAFALDIPYEVLDFTADFREQIIEKFVRVYEAGGTPNPCIDCNKYMKFNHLLSWAQAHGMEYVVTGHYARVEQDPDTGRWLLKKGLDEGKDQSYAPAAGGPAQDRGACHRRAASFHQCPQTRQPGHLLCARRRLCPLYGGLYRKALPRR